MAGYQGGASRRVSHILIGDGYAEENPIKPDVAVVNLTAAANWIISKSNRS